MSFHHLTNDLVNICDLSLHTTVLPPRSPDTNCHLTTGGAAQGAGAGQEEEEEVNKVIELEQSEQGTLLFSGSSCRETFERQ